MRHSLFPAAVVFVLLFGLAETKAAPTPTNAHTTTPIHLRHALSERDASALSRLVSRFNQANPSLAPVVLENAFDSGTGNTAPDLALAPSLENLPGLAGTPLAQPLPLAEALHRGGQSLAGHNWYPQVLAASGAVQGQPRGLPLALSIPVLFYNRDAFSRAKLNPDNLPATWEALQGVADTFFSRKEQCPLTSAQLSWIQLENMATINGEAALDASGRKLFVNNLPSLRHFSRLESWHKSAFFRTFDSDAQANDYFAQGICLMLMTSAADYEWISRKARFSLGAAPIPVSENEYQPDARRLLPDGLSLWVVRDRPASAYASIAQFLRFLADPAQQQEWVKATGYLPMSPAALPALTAAPLPPAVIAIMRDVLSAPVAGTPFPAKLRALVTTRLDALWRYQQTPKTVLDQIQLTGRSLLATSAVSADSTRKATPVVRKKAKRK